ncbi:hypothetical protein [Peribacillus frigoritolerans]|uniref:hypothetical protein n=1 Tax=Peribacillus frigoritolerans TaxID=450367 RepID=UPI002E1AF501|nr:hypothetical protein [Peribacillus frigoritolerans]MED3845546.1 hypothetical protein [Peribacillus frigoritolerans]
MNNIKLSKQKEKVLIPKYMSNGYEEEDGQFFEYEGMGFYLIKSNKSWCIIEKSTKLFVCTWRKTRKVAFEEFDEFMSKHLEKVKERVSKGGAD